MMYYINENNTKYLDHCMNDPDFDPNKQFKFNWYPINYIINSQNINLLNKLLGLNKPIKFDIIDDNELRPIQYAIMTNNYDIVKILIDAGIDIKIRLYKESYSLLHYAIDIDSNNEIIKLLISSGIDINDRNLINYTPVMLAAYRYNVRITKLLVELGAKLYFNSQGGIIDCLLVIIRKYSNDDINNNAAIETINILIIKYIIELSKKDKVCKRFLLLGFDNCIKNNKYEIIKLYINAGYDIDNSLPRSTTPIRYAIICKNVDLFKILVCDNSNWHSLKNVDWAYYIKFTKKLYDNAIISKMLEILIEKKEEFDNNINHLEMKKRKFSLKTHKNKYIKIV